MGVQFAIGGARNDRGPALKTSSERWAILGAADGVVVSGHTLKHLAAAAACFAILRYYQARRPITDA